MSSMQQVFAARPPASVQGATAAVSPLARRGFQMGDCLCPALRCGFFVFVVYPFGYALRMAARPSLYADLIADPLYLPTVVNTLLFVGLGVNVKMFLALLLSGFFLRPRRWIKALLGVFVLPWVIATAQACVSFHWMLQEEGLVNGVTSAMFGIEVRGGSMTAGSGSERTSPSTSGNGCRSGP